MHRVSCVTQQSAYVKVVRILLMRTITTHLVILDYPLWSMREIGKGEEHPYNSI